MPKRAHQLIRIVNLCNHDAFNMLMRTSKDIIFILNSASFAALDNQGSIR